MFERLLSLRVCLPPVYLSPLPFLSLSQSTCSLSFTISTMSSPPRVETTAFTQNEERCTIAIFKFFSHTGLSTPKSLGLFRETSIFARQRKEDSTRGIRPSMTVTRRKLPYFILFLMSSKLPSLTLQGETPQPMTQYAHCPGLIGPSLNSLWLKHETSAAIVMYSRILVKGPYRVTMQLYVSSFKKPTIRCNQGKRIPGCGCPNIPFSAQF